jgi:huntingtin
MTCFMRYSVIAGIFRRVAVASMSLLHQHDNSFNVELVISMFHMMSTRWPTLMVQWCNILILLNYGNKECWSHLLQTPQTFLTSDSRLIYGCLKSFLTFIKPTLNGTNASFYGF